MSCVLLEKSNKNPHRHTSVWFWRAHRAASVFSIFLRPLRAPQVTPATLPTTLSTVITSMVTQVYLGRNSVFHQDVSIVSHAGCILLYLKYWSSSRFKLQLSSPSGVIEFSEVVNLGIPIASHGVNRFTKSITPVSRVAPLGAPSWSSSSCLD